VAIRASAARMPLIVNCVVEQVLDEEWRGSSARGKIWPIAALAPSGGEQHPGVRCNAPVDQLIVGAHHACDHAWAQKIVRRTQNSRSQAAARKSDATRALGQNVRALAKVIESDSILVGDYRCDVGSKQCAVFRNKMFMQIGGAASDSIRRGGFRTESGFDRLGQASVQFLGRRPGETFDFPKEGVVDNNRKPFSSQQIAVGPAAIAGVAKPLKHVK
jgi:hypothetical protein